MERVSWRKVIGIMMVLTIIVVLMVNMLSGQTPTGEVNQAIQGLDGMRLF